MKKEIIDVDKAQGIARVTTTDERWYTKPAANKETGLPQYEFVPSVTWIAGHYPKGVAFYKWLANHGWDESQAIKQAAADKGSKIHQAINALILGNEIRMDAKFTNPETNQPDELSTEEYEAVLSFKDWYLDEQPQKIIASEYVVWGDGYAGTVDIKYHKKDGRIGILDLKSGQYIWPEYELQLSAYKHAHPDQIDFLEILQVGYKRNQKRYKLTEIEDKFPLFLAARQIWLNETAGQKPLQRDYPLSISLPKDTPEPPAPKVAKPKTQKQSAGN